MKKLLKIVAALVMAATLTACSDSSDNRYTSARDDYVSYYDNASSIIESNKSNIDNNGVLNTSTDQTVDHTFVFDGFTYSGTYTGDVVSGVPDGSGTFSGKSSDGDKVAATGTWKSGQLNGQDNVTVEYVEYMDTSSIIWKGQFVDNALNGEGECTIYYSAEYVASNDVESAVVKGQFKNNGPTGTVEATNYFTSSFAAEYGFDRVVSIGKWIGEEGMEPPYTAKYYNGDTLVDEVVME